MEALFDFILQPESLNIMLLGFGAYLALIMLALVVWTLIDSIKRSDSFFFQLFSTLLVMVFNVFGLVLYIMIRPPQTIQEQYDEELEREYILRQTMGERCPKCKSIVKSDYVLCPICTCELKEACSNCEKLILPTFRICPYCAAKKQEKVIITDEGEAIMEDSLRSKKKKKDA